MLRRRTQVDVGTAPATAGALPFTVRTPASAVAGLSAVLAGTGISNFVRRNVLEAMPVAPLTSREKATAAPARMRVVPSSPSNGFTEAASRLLLSAQGVGGTSGVGLSNSDFASCSSSSSTGAAGRLHFISLFVAEASAMLVADAHGSTAGLLNDARALAANLVRACAEQPNDYYRS